MVPPPVAPGARSEEYVSASAATAAMSACLLTTQKPTPSGVCTVGPVPPHRGLGPEPGEDLVGEAVDEDGRGR